MIGLNDWSRWLKVPFGKSLRRLHAWNAWVILGLALTGLLLQIPSVRTLGGVRVFIKDAHIVLGFVSISLVLLYVPFLRKHLKQIRHRRVQQWNLGLVLFLLGGWIVTGLILTFYRQLPPVWSNISLIGHDVFTYVGIPYVIYHSVTRLRWVKEGKKSLEGEETQQLQEESVWSRAGRQLDRLPISRRSFVKVTAGTLLVIAIGPSFFRFLKRMFDTGGQGLDAYIEADANRMLPPPEPLRESVEVIGGGHQGNFRIYTVTEIPAFASTDWHFRVEGLVEKPMKVDWSTFLQIPRTVQVSDFHCITGWSVYSCTWEGIPLSALLDQAKVKTSAAYVKFYSGDGVYTDTLTIEQARLEDVLVAVMLDGKPIPQDLGGPVRLIVPQMYAYKSVKWLQSIELIDEEHIGYWEQRGYPVDAWV